MPVRKPPRLLREEKYRSTAYTVGFAHPDYVARPTRPPVSRKVKASCLFGIGPAMRKSLRSKPNRLISCIAFDGRQRAKLQGIRQCSHGILLVLVPPPDPRRTSVFICVHLWLNSIHP